MTRLLVAIGVAAALTFAMPRRAVARYEYARAVGKRCSTCHASHKPDVTNLNAAGLHYLANGSLPSPTRPPAPRAAAASGSAALFARNCAPCHGGRGEGTAKARALFPAVRARTTAEIAAVVRKGIDNTAMFAFGDVLSDQEIRALSEYVATLRTR